MKESALRQTGRKGWICREGDRVGGRIWEENLEGVVAEGSRGWRSKAMDWMW